MLKQLRYLRRGVQLVAHDLRHGGPDHGNLLGTRVAFVMTAIAATQWYQVVQEATAAMRRQIADRQRWPTYGEVAGTHSRHMLTL